jgi:hypothetical protein
MSGPRSLLTACGYMLRQDRRIGADRSAVPFCMRAGEVQFKTGNFPFKPARHHPELLRRTPEDAGNNRFLCEGVSSSTNSFEGLGSPIALRSPSSRTTRQGPACPSFGTGPIDLLTTPPAPRISIRESDAPVVPSMPAARRRWLPSSTPPTVTLPGLIETIHQEMVVIYY